MRHPDDFAPLPGQPEEIAPGIRRILCDNPSAFTFRGTNTYLVGKGSGIAVIDPGPLDVHHQAAIEAALAPGERITHIFVTHAHADHAPLARYLARSTGAPVLAHGDAETGRSEVMRRLAAQGGLGGGEGVDADFAPDRRLAHDEIVEGDGWRIRALWTPGHQCNHMSFDLAFEGESFGTVFCGDHVMAWSTSIVSPPDGDLTQFMESCALLRERPARVYYPGHGPELTAPHDRLDWLVAHRRTREEGILRALAEGPADAQLIARRVYTDIAAHLLPAAERNVLAHLIDLASKKLVIPEGDLAADAVFRPVGGQTGK
ncbi:metallo-beta-lactamase family protein [Pseudooceanicola batsensis HTCC2597]|uniref:Metallo-beta-lactamase family protein n=1 Tax=Pseudooceanicola batsensis (strain ATCC BAA-863 / DSM 15984 / KCTC 12145 / HTCC2597) TaxID=252305 RepID=A3TXM6_PSEBH|nr:MBL fold metallo-hydrolase [Pseudooceanicola batsensis]EAQ03586.1 metallo-beta-lactamase family protein [Pseudooceanicola batsensis HTCC2597]